MVKKVWVVMANSWNGESDSISVHKVFLSQKSADDYCRHWNALRNSSYSTEYEYEEFVVEALNKST